MSAEKEQSEEMIDSFMAQERVLRLIGVWPLDNHSFAKLSIGRWFFAMLTQVSFELLDDYPHVEVVPCVVLLGIALRRAC